MEEPVSRFVKCIFVRVNVGSSHFGHHLMRWSSFHIIERGSPSTYSSFREPKSHEFYSRKAHIQNGTVTTIHVAPMSRDLVIAKSEPLITESTILDTVST